MLARTLTIRRSLLLSLALLVLGTSSAILAVTLWSASTTAAQLSRGVIHATSDRAHHELDRFFDPIRRQLRVAQQWGRSGMLTTDAFARAGLGPSAEEPPSTDVGDVNRLFIPALERFPQVSSLLLANEEGVELLLLQMHGAWKNRITRVGLWGRRTFWLDWRNERELLGTSWQEKDYDPRKRPWFRGAVGLATDDAIHWTDPYVFFTTRDPGITAAMRFSGSTGGPRHVIAFDVLLTDLSRFTTRLAVSERGAVAILTEEGAVVGLPRDARFDEPDEVKKAVLSHATEIGFAPLAAAVEHWSTLGKTLDPVALTVGGERWWAGFRPYELGAQRLWSVVLVPESDFLAEVERQRDRIVVVTLAALFVAIALAFWLSRRYAAPLEQLAAQSRRIGELDLQPGAPIESRLLEVQQLAQAQSTMLSALDSFARYVPIDVVRELVKQGEVARIGGRTKHLTVLFTDIRGFTTIAEAMPPGALTEHMAEYFDEMLAILHAQHATVDKFVGDAIVAFWGAPLANEEHSVHAVQAVLGCVERLKELNARWQERGLPPLPTCFGVGTGEVVVGNIGSRTRLSYTVLGDTVNLVSRIEGLNRLYGTDVLATESVVADTADGYLWRRVDCVAVKGKSRPETIYEPLGRKGEVPEERLRFARRYEMAFDRYQARDFAGAHALLAELHLTHPHDRSVARLLQICIDYEREPPHDDWDGVARLRSK